LDIFECGKSRARALLLYELHAPLVLYAKSQFDVGHLSQMEYLERLLKAREVLNESREVLEWEDENICMIVISARKSLQNLDTFIASIEISSESI
jgi:hypothetical protein